MAIGIIWSDDNLVEDCVAAGTGRYMINVFTSQHNTLRRCFTMWQQWDGRHFCGVSWPNGNNVGRLQLEQHHGRERDRLRPCADRHLRDETDAELVGLDQAIFDVLVRDDALERGREPVAVRELQV